MAKPKWITLGTAEGSMNGSSEITAAAYTGRVAREGTITGTTAGGAVDTTAVSQVGAAEVITIETKEYSANAVGQNITIQGKSNSADLNIVAGDSTISGLIYKLAVAGVTDESWNGNSDISVDGDPGASAMYDFTLIVTVPENKSTSALVAKFAVKNANADVTSGEITINQAAGVKNYAVPLIITFSYDASIPASGGSVSPTLNYMQKWGWNESDSNGGIESDHTPAAGVTSFEGGSSTNKDTGVVTASSKGTVESGITEVDNVTLVVTLNGKSSAPKSASVKQAANAASYGDVSFSSRVPSVADIPASGGSVDKADIIWSGEGAIVTQKITYSSGAEVTITDEDGSTAFNPIHIAYGDPITAASKGTAVSARTEAGVITMVAEGAGDKTATKTLTVYQAANSATYGEVTIGQATPVSLAAPGETYAIVPAMKQTVTYTSGATRTESTPADNKVQLSADYAVKTPKEGFSLETDTGKVTVNLNPTTAPREGFVVTISAEGEGGKTATKDITFNQQGSNSTLDLSPDTLSFIAAGETKTLTITSNDSWTLS
nr:MAG TPA: hypothetical protein [Crassvirales sp.]